MGKQCCWVVPGGDGMGATRFGLKEHFVKPMQSQNAGLSPTLGGGDYRTKRGLEKTVVMATIFFSAVFLGLSLLTTITR